MWIARLSAASLALTLCGCLGSGNGEIDGAAHLAADAIDCCLDRIDSEEFFYWHIMGASGRTTAHAMLLQTDEARLLSRSIELSVSRMATRMKSMSLKKNYAAFTFYFVFFGTAGNAIPYEAILDWIRRVPGDGTVGPLQIHDMTHPWGYAIDLLATADKAKLSRLIWGETGRIGPHLGRKDYIAAFSHKEDLARSFR